MHNIIYDLIGVLHKPTGLMLKSEEGFEYPEMVAIDGYHVNVLPPIVAELEPFIIEPSNQTRVFAGRDDTVCLKFKDRAEWLSLGIEQEEELL